MTDNVIYAIENMLLPLMLLGTGAIIWKTKPGYKDMFAYHTTTAEKNEQMWNRAQELFGRICTITYAVLSAVTLIVGLIPIICGLDKSIGVVICDFLVVVNIVPMFVFIGIVEITLKKEFDKDGNRRGGDSHEY